MREKIYFDAFASSSKCVPRENIFMLFGGLQMQTFENILAYVFGVEL